MSDENDEQPSGNVVPIAADSPGPELRAEVARYAHTFHKPAAVQLQQPYLAIEAAYESEDGEVRALVTKGHGWPQVGKVPNPQTRDGLPLIIETALVLFGSLGPTADGQLLLFRRRATTSGSMTEITLDPSIIHSVTLVPEPAPPPQASRIVRPGG